MTETTDLEKLFGLHTEAETTPAQARPEGTRRRLTTKEKRERPSDPDAAFPVEPLKSKNSASHIKDKWASRPDDPERLMRRGPIIETNKAVQAWEDFWLLGKGRTIALLHQQYVTEAKEKGKAAVPTVRLQTLWSWYSSFDWRSRVFARNASIAEQTEAKLVAERAEYASQRLRTGRILTTASHNFFSLLLSKLAQLQGMDLAGKTVTDLQAGTVTKHEGLLHQTSAFLRMAQLGGEIERKELGDGEARLKRFAELVLQYLPEKERAQLQANLALLLEEESGK